MNLSLVLNLNQEANIRPKLELQIFQRWFIEQRQVPYNRDIICCLEATIYSRRSRATGSYTEILANLVSYRVVKVTLPIIVVGRQMNCHGVTSTRFTPFGAVTPFQIALA